jgi:hypothetical protein
MGPANPWSPHWQPDPTGRRRLTIRAARRGAYLAAATYLPIAIVAAALARNPLEALPPAMTAPVALIAVGSGLFGIALLGAGLAPAALGSKIDAFVVGIAFAIGGPVAATASFVIWGWLFDSWVDSWYGAEIDVAAPFLRAGVIAALQVAPLVALGAAAWVVILRRVSAPLPLPPPSTPPPAATGL